MRAPLSTDLVSDRSDVEAWLRTPSDEFAKAQVSLEHARSVMIRAHKASERAHVYHEGALVKVSTKVVDVVSTSTQAPKLQPKYIGPFKVIAVGEHGTVTLDLPDAYSRIHNVCHPCWTSLLSILWLGMMVPLNGYIRIDCNCQMKKSW